MSDGRLLRAVGALVRGEGRRRLAAREGLERHELAAVELRSSFADQYSPACSGREAVGMGMERWSVTYGERHGEDRGEESGVLLQWLQNKLDEQRFDVEIRAVSRSANPARRKPAAHCRLRQELFERS